MVFAIQCVTHVKHDSEEYVEWLERMVALLTHGNHQLHNALNVYQKDNSELCAAIVNVTKKLKEGIQ